MSAVTVLAKNVSRLLTTYSPQILTGVAVAGVVSTSVMAVKATPEAIRLIEDEQTARQSPLTPLEKIKFAWQPYIPAVALGGVTITCIISGHSISTRRNAAMMGLYTITREGFQEYQNKVTETIGEAKEQKIRDEVAKDRVERDPVTSREVIILGSGDVLFYDGLTGRYFQSDVQSIRKAENDINAKIINETFASQNDFYRLIGLDTVRDGEEVGWNTDVMLNLDFTTVMTNDDRPCISMNYRMSPIRGYYLNDF